MATNSAKPCISKEELYIIRAEYKLLSILNNLKESDNIDNLIKNTSIQEVKNTLNIVKVFKKDKSIDCITSDILNDGIKNNIRADVNRLVRNDTDFVKTMETTTDLSIDEYKDMLAVVEYCDTLERECKNVKIG